MPFFETGGQGLQYYPHNKLRLSESGKEKDKELKRVKYSTITAMTTKSRQVGKGMSTSYIFNYFTKDGTPTGIDHFKELEDIGIAEGLIEMITQQKYNILGMVECKKKDIRTHLVEEPQLLEALYIEVMKVLKVKMGHITEDEIEEVEAPKKSSKGGRRKRG